MATDRCATSGCGDTFTTGAVVGPEKRVACNWNIANCGIQPECDWVTDVGGAPHAALRRSSYNILSPYFLWSIFQSQTTYQSNKVVQLISIEPNWWRDRKLSTRWSLIVREHSKTPHQLTICALCSCFSYFSSFTSFIICRAGARDQLLNFIIHAPRQLILLTLSKKILRHRLTTVGRFDLQCMRR